MRPASFQLEGVDSMVLSLTAKALATGEIEATRPLAIVQTCVPHLIRNTFRLASRSDWDKMAKDLRPIYTAVNEAGAVGRLDEIHQIWGTKYPAIKGLLPGAWPEFVPFWTASPRFVG